MPITKIVAGFNIEQCSTSISEQWFNYIGIFLFIGFASLYLGWYIKQKVKRTRTRYLLTFCAMFVALALWHLLYWTQLNSFDCPLLPFIS